MLQQHIVSTIYQLSLKEQTPYYVYDNEAIRDNCKKIFSYPSENFSAYFATMANSEKFFLEIVRKEGMGVFVNSILHLNLAMEAGFKKNDIVFTASSMSESTMQVARQFSAVIHLDSIEQLKLWHLMFPGEKVGIRVNISNFQLENKAQKSGFFIGTQSRLGIDVSSFHLIPSPELISGLHIYAGTNVLDHKYLISCYRELLQTSSIFSDLEHMDFGGGFGVDNSFSSAFDFDTYFSELYQLMKEDSSINKRDLKILIEPGRIIAANTGFFVCKVIDVKYRNNKQIIVTDASVVQFPRPLLYPDDAFHPATLMSEDFKIKRDTESNSAIVGCSTYSRDYFADNVVMPKAKTGDFIVFANSGAYCASLYTEFLGFPKAKEYFI